MRQGKELKKQKAPHKRTVMCIYEGLMNIMDS